MPRAAIVGDREGPSTDVMTGRNQIGMLVFLVVGVAFVCIGLFSRAIPARDNKPLVLKWYHRIFAVIIGVNAIIIALYIGWGH
jgi:hypothetical protein